MKFRKFIKELGFDPDVYDVIRNLPTLPIKNEIKDPWLNRELEPIPIKVSQSRYLH
jgi:hypothetical protein